jgi:hypothetical protein
MFKIAHLAKKYFVKASLMTLEPKRGNVVPHRNQAAVWRSKVLASWSSSDELSAFEMIAAIPSEPVSSSRNIPP